jgi:hypothetical protein
MLKCTDWLYRERSASGVNKERMIVAHYGLEDEQYGKKKRWLTSEQANSFLESLPGRIFPKEVTHSNDQPIACLVVDRGELLPSEIDPRYGSIVAIGSHMIYTPLTSL